MSRLDDIVRSARFCLVSGCLEPAAPGEVTCAGHPVQTYGIAAADWSKWKAAPVGAIDVVEALKAMGFKR